MYLYEKIAFFHGKHWLKGIYTHRKIVLFIIKPKSNLYNAPILIISYFYTTIKLRLLNSVLTYQKRLYARVKCCLNSWLAMGPLASWTFISKRPVKSENWLEKFRFSLLVRLYVWTRMHPPRSLCWPIRGNHVYVDLSLKLIR